jgi:hypothetical protein
VTSRPQASTEAMTAKGRKPPDASR